MFVSSNTNSMLKVRLMYYNDMLHLIDQLKRNDGEEKVKVQNRHQGPIPPIKDFKLYVRNCL